jgi:hypothetical protein
MGIYVPAALAGAYHLRAMHDAWDAEQHAPEHAPPTAGAGDQPAKPLTRAREKPDRGSRDNRHLLAQAMASMQGTATQSAPVTRRPAAGARALAPAIDIAIPGIGAVASSVSSAMAKGVNAIAGAAFEKSKALDGAVHSSAGPAVVEVVASARTLALRQRGRLSRFMLPMPKAA